MSWRKLWQWLQRDSGYTVFPILTRDICMCVSYKTRSLIDERGFDVLALRQKFLLSSNKEIAYQAFDNTPRSIEMVLYEHKK